MRGVDGEKGRRKAEHVLLFLSFFFLFFPGFPRLTEMKKRAKERRASITIITRASNGGVGKKKRKTHEKEVFSFRLTESRDVRKKKCR